MDILKQICEQVFMTEQERASHSSCWYSHVSSASWKIAEHLSKPWWRWHPGEVVLRTTVLLKRKHIHHSCINQHHTRKFSQDQNSHFTLCETEYFSILSWSNRRVDLLLRNFRGSYFPGIMTKIDKTFKVSESRTKLLLTLQLWAARDGSRTSKETKLSLESECYYQGANILREAKST